MEKAASDKWKKEKRNLKYKNQKDETDVDSEGYAAFEGCFK